MNRPNIPYRFTRLRAGESTYTDLSNPDLDQIEESLNSQGYQFYREVWDGGVFLHCTRSPNRIIRGEEK